METKTKKYFAFISYKREDEEWAKWFQYELENYQLPYTLNNRRDLPKSFRPVFRDMDELKAGNLQEQIYDALASSLNLVVICSSRLADDENAKWVNKEIMDFIEIGEKEGTNNIRHIFPFIVDGVPLAGDERECFPKALRELSKEQERIGGNINEGGNVTDINRERAFVKVLAGMLPDSVSFDMLWNRYDRDKMERERKEKEERDKLLIAQSRFVAERIQKLIDEGDTDTAIRLALEVLPKDLSNPDRPYCVGAEAALRKAVWFDKVYRVFKGHDDQVVSARFSPNDGIIVSTSKDDTLRIWDVNDGRELFSVPVIWVASFDSNKDSSLVLIISNSVLWLFDVEKKEQKKLLDGVAYARFFQESNRIFVAKERSCFMVLDLDVPENDVRIEVSYESFRFVERLNKVLIYKNRGFYYLDLETKELDQIIDDCDAVKQFSISFDECAIQCLCSDDTYYSWNLHGTKLVEYKVEGPERIVKYSPDRKHLLLSSNQVVNCETGKEVKVFEKIKDSSINEAVFSADGRFLALSTYKGRIVWDSKTKKCMSLDDAIGKIHDFAFSHVGDILLCASTDGTIKMIAIDTNYSLFGKEKGREIALYRHVDDVIGIRFISNGQKLVSSSLCSIIVWSITNDERIGYYPGNEISLDKMRDY